MATKSSSFIFKEANIVLTAYMINIPDKKKPINSNFFKNGKPKTLLKPLNIALIGLRIEEYFNFQGLNYTNILMLILLNNLLDSCGKVRQQINWKFWKSQKKKIDYDKLNECFAEVLLSLITIFKSINCSPEQIKDIYIKKNMENIFRQEFNY